MCGLAGMFIEPRQRSRDDVLRLRALFYGILSSMDSRGGDGCGVAVINQNGEVVRHTRLPMVEASEAYFDREFADTLAQINDDTRCIIGHTRLATQGSKALDVNFHPFVTKNVVGAHNGMFYNWDEIIAHFNLTPEGDCDSEPVFHLMDLMSGNRPLNVDIINTALKCMEGVYALTLQDLREPDAVWLLAGTNPIFTAYDNDLGVRVWASTADGVYDGYDALNRFEAIYGMPITFAKKGRLLPDYTGLKVTTKDIASPEIEFRVPATEVYRFWYGLTFGSGEEADDSFAKANTVTQTQPQGTECKAEVVDDIEFSFDEANYTLGAKLKAALEKRKIQAFRPWNRKAN